jgi:hypothetical protein
MALSTPPVAPQRGDRTTFASRVDAFITWLIGFVSELNIFSANMNSIAAGGAYAIPYTFSTSISPVGYAAGGYLAFDNGTNAQTTATIWVDTKSAAGALITAALNATVAGNNSAVKGQIRLVAVSDPSRWALFNVTAYSTYSTGYYGTFTVTPVDRSAAAPFSNNEQVQLHFQRTGDKGDAGSLTSVLWVRDEKASGAGGGTAAASSYTTRTLNTIKKNTISGASVASNQITLPAGTYRVSFSAPAYSVSGHQAYLYNVTDAATAISGSTAYVSGTSVQTESGVRGTEIVLTASKVFELRHWTNTNTAGTGLGLMASSGQGEVYAQVFIEKVS